MKRGIVLIIMALTCLTVTGCDDMLIDLEGYTPTLYIDDIPIYTGMTAPEVCVLTAVIDAYHDRYGIGTNGVKGLWLVRDYDQAVPCMDGPNGTACQWSEVNAVFGYPDKGVRGMGGVAYNYQYVFVSRYEGHEPFLALNLMHEFGHAILKMRHDTPAERAAWCLWENDMWFDWTLDRVRMCGVPPMQGTHWYLCPWCN